MKAVCQLRINNAFVNLLPKRIVGDNVGPVTIIKIEVGSPEYNLIHQIALKVFSEKSESLPFLLLYPRYIFFLGF